MDNKKMMIIPEGAMLTVSTGEYSDYYVHGVFRAIKEINANKLRDEWVALHPIQAEDYRFDRSEFLAWVARDGYLEPIDSFEWYLGGYSKISEMDVSHE